GGAVVTNDDEIAGRCRRLRNHGRLNKDVHAEVGFNLRFNDIQAAVGRVLLRRLDAMNERRRELAARYATPPAGLPLELPRAPAQSSPSRPSAPQGAPSSPLPQGSGDFSGACTPGGPAPATPPWSSSRPRRFR